MRYRTTVCIFAALFFATSVARGGSMTTFLTPTVRYSDEFVNVLPFTTTGGRVDPGQPGIYQIDITFIAVNEPGDKGWANTLFDMGVINNAMASNLALDLATGYSPNAETFDTWPLPGGRIPIYGTNTDAGAPGDLKGILASIPSATITTGPRDTRNLLGTPGAPAAAGYPSYIGSIFVEWNGLGSGDVVLTNQQYSFTTTANTFGVVQTGAGASTGFGAVPEPASLALLGIGIIGATQYRRSGIQRRR